VRGHDLELVIVVAAGAVDPERGDQVAGQCAGGVVIVQGVVDAIGLGSAGAKQPDLLATPLGLEDDAAVAEIVAVMSQARTTAGWFLLGIDHLTEVVAADANLTDVVSGLRERIGTAVEQDLLVIQAKDREAVVDLGGGAGDDLRRAPPLALAPD